MYWNKIKTVLIILFAAADIFFLFNLYRQYMNQNYIDEALLNDTAALLSEAGITVAEGAVPERLFEESVVECRYGEDYYEKIFHRLGGGEDYSSFIKTGALGQGMKFTSDANNITAEFYGDFYLRYVKGDVQTRETELSDYLSALTGENPDGMSAIGNEILALLDPVGSSKLRSLARILENIPLVESTGNNLKIEFVIEACAYDAEKDRYLLNCREYVEDFAVYDSEALVIVEDEEIVWFSGSVIFFEISNSYVTGLYDQINILFDEKSYVEENADENEICEITKMDLVYCVSWYSGGDMYYIIPAWRITYSGGTVRIRSALNGSLYDI